MLLGLGNSVRWCEGGPPPFFKRIDGLLVQIGVNPFEILSELDSPLRSTNHQKIEQGRWEGQRRMGKQSFFCKEC